MGAAADLLTPQEAAERMGVADRTIYSAVRRGKLPALRLSGSGCGSRLPRLLIPKDALDHYDATRKRPVRPLIRARIRAEGAAGVGPNAIARRLNAEALPAPGGGKWHPGTVHKILTA